MVGACGPQLLLDAAERRALAQHQDQPGAEDISGRQRPGLSDVAEFQLLVFAEHKITAGHTWLDVIRASNLFSATVH